MCIDCLNYVMDAAFECGSTEKFDETLNKPIVGSIAVRAKQITGANNCHVCLSDVIVPGKCPNLTVWSLYENGRIEENMMNDTEFDRAHHHIYTRTQSEFVGLWGKASWVERGLSKIMYCGEWNYLKDGAFHPFDVVVKMEASDWELSSKAAVNVLAAECLGEVYQINTTEEGL